MHSYNLIGSNPLNILTFTQCIFWMIMVTLLSSCCSRHATLAIIRPCLNISSASLKTFLFAKTSEQLKSKLQPQNMERMSECKGQTVTPKLSIRRQSWNVRAKAKTLFVAFLGGGKNYEISGVPKNIFLSHKNSYLDRA